MDIIHKYDQLLWLGHSVMVPIEDTDDTFILIQVNSNHCRNVTLMLSIVQFKSIHIHSN